MKDKLFLNIDKVIKHFYAFIMWLIYKYKTIIICKHVVKLNPDYKKEIRSYWGKYYKRISLKDFRWYKTKDNVMDFRLIPDVVFHSKIEPYFNDLKTMDAFSNKCYYNLLFQGYKVPFTIAKNINGKFMDDNFHLIPFREVIKRCCNEEEIIIKPAINSGGGRNIIFLKMNKPDSEKQLEDLLRKWSKDFVIQRIVKQHKELDKINPTSLNTVRIQSFLYKNKVYILSAFLRVGRKGCRIDNLCQGGIAISIKENGDFHSVGYDENGNKTTKHRSGYVFEGNKMPGFDKIVESVKALHPRYSNFGFIGWDIAIDRNGDPVIIEFNLIDTCIRAAQLSNGPLFRNLTDKVLDDVFGKNGNKKKIKKKKLEKSK